MDVSEQENRVPEDGDTTIEEHADELAQSQKIKKLTDKLKQCEHERIDYLAGWQRAKADFINARKEEEKRRSEFIRYAEVSLIRELLPLLDSFDSARKVSGERNHESRRWLQGIKSIEQQFWQILRQHGVEQISTKGKFDPALHEAIATVPAATIEEDFSIVQEEQAGYRLGDTILRPARVQIGKYNKHPPETIREDEKEENKMQDT